MSKFYGEMHARFPEYEEPQKARPKMSNTDTATETELLETIDLTDPAHNAADSYSLADTVSIKTDLTDIAGDGEREGEGGNRKLRSLGESVILSVSSFGSNMRENMRENISGRVRERLGGSGGVEETVWARRTDSPGEVECKICKHPRRTSWWTVIGLLMIDLITLIILFYGYDTLKFHGGKAGRRGLAPLGPAGRTGTQDLPHLNFTEELGPRGRSLDLPSSTEMDMLEGKTGHCFAFISIFMSLLCPVLY